MLLPLQFLMHAHIIHLPFRGCSREGESIFVQNQEPHLPHLLLFQFDNEYVMWVKYVHGNSLNLLYITPLHPQHFFHSKGRKKREKNFHKI